MMYAHTDGQTDGQTHCCFHNIDRWIDDVGKKADFFVFLQNVTKNVLKPGSLHEDSINIFAGPFCLKLRKKLHYTQTDRQTDGQTRSYFHNIDMISKKLSH